MQYNKKWITLVELLIIITIISILITIIVIVYKDFKQLKNNDIKNTKVQQEISNFKEDYKDYAVTDDNTSDNEFKELYEHVKANDFYNTIDFGDDSEMVRNVRRYNNNKYQNKSIWYMAELQQNVLLYSDRINTPYCNFYKETNNLKKDILKRNNIDSEYWVESFTLDEYNWIIKNLNKFCELDIKDKSYIYSIEDDNCKKLDIDWNIIDVKELSNNQYWKIKDSLSNKTFSYFSSISMKCLNDIEDNVSKITNNFTIKTNKKEVN